MAKKKGEVAVVDPAVERREEQHVEQVKEIVQLMDSTARKTQPLDLAGQQERRTAERRVRRQAVAFARWTGREGQSRRQSACRLGLPPSTLDRWQRGWDRARLPWRPLGRPRPPLAPLQRLDLSQHLQALGPAVGLPTLRGLFPDIVRSRLREAQQEFRGVWHQRHALWTEVLTWTTPGTVWAADFTDPPRPIDGLFGHVLTTRDLASSMQLLGDPVAHEDADTLCRRTEWLFLTWGAPLVYKADNGPAFISEDFAALLRDWGVTLLLSPPRMPRYNGSAEAGNGSLKWRTLCQAMAHGRDDDWTSDDVEAALQELNTTLRPGGASQPTPWATWQQRKPITPEQRIQFRQTVQHATAQAWTKLALSPEPSNRTARAVVARAAVRRALETLGYLLVQRRRITPPVHSPLRARIT